MEEIMHFLYWTVFIEKTLHISGPAQFEPVLFKDQLYFIGTKRSEINTGLYNFPEQEYLYTIPVFRF